MAKKSLLKVEIIHNLLLMEFFVNKEREIHYKTTNLCGSACFNFFRLVSVSKFFLKRFFPFSNVFNDVLSPPVIKNFYAVTMFLVTHYAVHG